MTLSARSIAVEGFGFGARHIALQGFAPYLATPDGVPGCAHATFEPHAVAVLGFFPYGDASIEHACVADAALRFFESSALVEFFAYGRASARCVEHASSDIEHSLFARAHMNISEVQSTQSFESAADAASTFEPVGEAVSSFELYAEVDQEHEPDC